MLKAATDPGTDNARAVAEPDPRSSDYTMNATHQVSDQSESGGRYWLMALGEESRHWDSCHAERIAFIGWDDVGDLRQYKSKDQLKEHGLGMHEALACWEFCHVMKPGDMIFVKKGTTFVLGHGIVKSDYSFDDARPEYKHVRGVEWLSKTDGVKIRGRELARKTLTDITKDPGQVADVKRALNIERDREPQAWTEFLRRLERCRAHPDFEANEVTYKLEVAAQVKAARERFQSGAEGWEDLLRRAFTSKLNNLTNWRSRNRFVKWMRANTDQCRVALHALWSSNGPPEERLQGFCDEVPTDTLWTLGQYLNIGTFLLMAEDVRRLPPAKIEAFRKAWKLAGRADGPSGNGPGAVYGDILRFLDELVRDGHDWPVPLRDRLDAQGAVWWATRPDEDKNGPEPPDPRPDAGTYTLEHAGRDLFRKKLDSQLRQSPTPSRASFRSSVSRARGPGRYRRRAR